MLTLWVAYLVSLKERDQRPTLRAVVERHADRLGAAAVRAAPTRTCSRSFLLPSIVGLGFARLWDRPKLRSLAGARISLGTGLVTERFQRLNDRPFGLNANLYTADLMQRFGSIKPSLRRPGVPK